MRGAPWFIGLIIGAASPAASAHHVVSTNGIAWVEPLTVAEVDVEAAAFDLGGEFRGDWQGLAARLEVAPSELVSLSARVPWAHLHLADGRRAVGLGDVEASVKVRLYETPHGGFISSAGLGVGLPTGDVKYGLGAGHLEFAPFAAISAHPWKPLVIDAFVTQKGSVSGTASPENGPHGALIAPHADRETALAVGAAFVHDRWYARLAGEGAIAWNSPMDSIAASLDVGFALPGTFRLSVGGTVPVAGYQRSRWRTHVAAAMQFN